MQLLKSFLNARVRSLFARPESNGLFKIATKKIQKEMFDFIRALSIIK